MEPNESPAPALSHDDFLADPACPRWIRDVFRFLPVKAHFVLSGNIRDRFMFPVPSGSGCASPHRPLSILPYLAEALYLRGVDYTLAYDPIDGFQAIAAGDCPGASARDFFKQRFSLSFNSNGFAPSSLSRSLEVLQRIVSHREHFIAVCLDFASRYAVRVAQLSDAEHEYFTRALKLSHNALPHTTKTQPAESMYNPVLWLCEASNDLPDWLVVNNPKLRSISLPEPDHIVRRVLVEAVSPGIPGSLDLKPADVRTHQTEFVELTNGMNVNDLLAVVQLCRRESIDLVNISEAVRRYKLGVVEDPWRRVDRTKIANGEAFIGQRLKGQHQAVVKALDIIKRAVTGLSGSQGGKLAGKPRGVMFLAGPTGVGKTELAKSITELLFGDESAMIRFDMSEFSAQHSDQRLLGAPPGYVGYDVGGELTNAIRQRPFSVVLFDEIEKAHPRLLDKFLQMLDEGVLTSGRGERCYFSEAVIIFTSNLGIFRVDESGQRIPNVTASDDYATVQSRVRFEIAAYFKAQLNRPEILNRIGENIVVFDFIREEAATQIFHMMVANILDRLARELQVRVTLHEQAMQVLLKICLGDLSNGGRGIGNQLEAWLVNPLARSLFDLDVQPGSSVGISQIGQTEGVPTLWLEPA